MQRARGEAPGASWRLERVAGARKEEGGERREEGREGTEGGGAVLPTAAFARVGVTSVGGVTAFERPSGLYVYTAVLLVTVF